MLESSYSWISRPLFKGQAHRGGFNPGLLAAKIRAAKQGRRGLLLSLRCYPGASLISLLPILCP